MLAPGKSMQADLHAARFPYVLIIYSLPVVFVCNALFLSLLLCFHMYKPQTNVYLCKALIPFGVKTAECHGAPNL